ncbi:MAG: ABC1 kinase family protein [Myxococcota bacterium]
MPPAETRRRQTAAITLRSLHMLEAGVVAGAVGIGELLRSLGRGREAFPHALGRALVSLCARLGATFIKIGQIASTRTDLLPKALCEELAKLQDRVPAFGFDRVRETVESDLGGTLESIFTEFEREPVAAASVAQVHRAVLRDGGAEVAVKVRRPDIADKVDLDRSIMLFVARILERVIPSLRIIGLAESIEQFADAVEHQLHLTHEAEHNRRFTANFESDPDVAFPVLHDGLCTDSVLTMDFVHGVHERDLAERGVDVIRVVEAGMRAVCRMIFLHGFVHADLHPGNLRFLPPGRLVLLDLGLVGELADEDRVTTARLLFALATGDGVTVARLFYDNSPHAAVADYAAYERDIQEFVSSVKDKGLANLQVTLEIGRIFDILRRHRVQAKSHMTMVNLALMTAEGLGRRLAPDLSLTDEALPYLAEALGVATPPGSAGSDVQSA